MLGAAAFVGWLVTIGVAANFSDTYSLGVLVGDNLRSVVGSAAAIAIIAVVCLATGGAARYRGAAVGSAVADVVLPGIFLGLVALEQNWAILAVLALVVVVIIGAATAPHRHGSVVL